MAVALLAEAAMGALAWERATLDAHGWAFVGATHLVAAVLSGEALRSRATGDVAGFYWLGLLLTLLFPVLGVLGTAWMVVAPPEVRVGAGESPEDARGRAMRAAWDDLRAREVSGPEIEAVAEALHDPDPALQLGAVEALRGVADAEAVRLLREASRSERFDVRFGAVDALGQLSRDHAVAVAAAEEAVRRAPEDADAHSALARCHAAYHDLEVEDPVVQAIVLRRAAEHFYAAARLRPEKAALLGLAASLSKAGSVGDAERVLDQTAVSDAHDPELLLARARLRFRAGDIDALRVTARRALWNDDGELSEDSRRALELWAS